MSAFWSPTHLVDRADLLAGGVDDLPARLDHEPGDGIAHTDRPSTYQTGPCVWTGFGVREHAQDPELAADLLLVDALEAAARHLRRRAVAEAARDPEPEARSAAVASRVDRRHQQRGALEPVARDELDLGVEVAPVGRQRGERGVPGRRRASPAAARRAPARGLAGADELERAADPLLVEPRQQPLDERGGCARRRAAPRRTARTFPRRARVQRPEKRGRAGSVARPRSSAEAARRPSPRAARRGSPATGRRGSRA